jgi:cytochrome c-type biogenesis protein
VEVGAVLLPIALVLGLLAFYEPCTIATHTLFAARAHAAPPRRRREKLTGLVIARCALLAALLGAAAALGPWSAPAGAAALALVTIGLVYLVTRWRYLPVPHLEAFRVLPAHDRLPEGVRLGLTLPACTLPLVAIAAALAAMTGRPALSAAAGAIFGAAFAAPTLRDSIRGLEPARRAFLARAAAAAWLTTALLWIGAAWVWRAGS